MARAAEVPTITLRYYERVGLVHPTSRGVNTYRLYTAKTLDVIRFIRAAQAAGFTLEDIRTLLGFHAEDLACCQEVQPLIAKRLAEVSQRLTAMLHLQRLLQSFLTQCYAQAPDAPCPVLETLSRAASSRVCPAP